MTDFAMAHESLGQNWIFYLKTTEILNSRKTEISFVNNKKL